MGGEQSKSVPSWWSQRWEESITQNTTVHDMPPLIFKRDIKTKIIFVGNPAVGKSTLLNQIIQTARFESGISIGTGLTTCSQIHTLGEMEFIDTPGLSDILKRKQASKEIEMALKRDGLYSIFFVINLRAGRVISDDVTTMKLVLDALSKVSNLDYGIIINKMTKGEEDAIKDLDDFKVLLATINHGLPLKTIFVKFVKEYPKARSEANVILPRDIALEDFICKLRPVDIPKENVQKLYSDQFEKERTTMEENIQKLRQNKDLLLMVLAEIKRDEERIIK